MPNPVPSPQTVPPPQLADAGHIPMTEEMDRAKWTLPPVIPVLVAAVVVLAVLALYTSHAAKPMITGKILGAYAAQNGPSQVLVGVQLSLQNSYKEPLWVKDIRVELKPAGDAAAKPPLS